MYHAALAYPACIILLNTCCQKIICTLLLLLIWDEQLKRRSLCVFIQFAFNRAQCFAVNQPLEVLRSPTAQWVSSQFIFDSLLSPRLPSRSVSRTLQVYLSVFLVYLWRDESSTPHNAPDPLNRMVCSCFLSPPIPQKTPDSEEILSARCSRVHHPPAALTPRCLNT